MLSISAMAASLSSFDPAVNLIMCRLLFFDANSLRALELEGSRAPPKTIAFCRLIRISTRPYPMPRLAPETVGHGYETFVYRKIFRGRTEINGFSRHG